MQPEALLKIFTETLESFGGNQATGQIFGSFNTILKTYDATIEPFKLFSLFVSLFFIAGIIYFMIRTGWINSRSTRIREIYLKKNTAKKKVHQAWARVQKHVYAGDESNLKLAIIEADKIVDNTMKDAGFPGETFGERLKTVNREDLRNLDDLWDAHRLRNQIVHEHNVTLRRESTQRALKAYELALKELGVLD